MKRICSLLLAGTLLMCPGAGRALAEGFALSDWGARGTSLGGGMVGRADDPSAVAYNPAGITQLPGTRAMGGVTVITPMGTLVTQDKSGREERTDVERHFWLNPHAYLTHQYSDNVWFGFGVFSRFGLGNSYPHDWPGRGNLVDVQLQTLSLNPNVAFKVTDQLSLAFGVEIMGASMVMHKDTLPEHPQYGAMGRAEQRMDGMSVGFGFNAAAHYTYNEHWSAGLTYRSRVKQDVKGDSTWTKRPSSPLFAQAFDKQFVDSDLHGTLNLPDVISFGLTWNPTPDLSFEAGTVYTVWSHFRSLNIYLEDPMNYVGYTPKNWHDTWGFNISAEYRVLDWMTLRAGYIWEESPMDDATMDYMTPSNGRERYSVGVGFNRDRWTLDLAYSYINIESLNYDSAASHNGGVLPGHSRGGHAHVMAASLGYTF